METGIADKSKQPDGKEQGATPVPEKRVAGNEGNTEETPKYTQKEVDALLGKSGQKMKAQLELVIKERDDFRSKHESVAKTHDELNSQIETAQGEIQTLKDTLDSLETADATKVRQLIRDWERKLGSLTDREKNLTPREERVNTFERTELIYAVADEYGLEEPEAKDRFKSAADRLKINDRDGLSTLAETMNLKAKEEPDEPKPKAPIPYSGKTDGGNTGIFTVKEIQAMSPKQITELQKKEGKTLLQMIAVGRIVDK